MKKTILAVLAAGLLFAACAVGTGYHGELVVAPALPTIVVLESEPYYVHGGYHYHYQGNAWYYSKSRGGPWKELPRDRYPKETRFKGKDRGDDRDRGEKRGHDRY